MRDNLTQNILATICYYDVLDYPLTAFELWRHLIDLEGNQGTEGMKLSDIIFELEKEELKKKIETYRGYYFFSGRKNLVSQRILRNKISEEKYRIIRRVVWFLRLVPFVRMVLATGRVAMKNADKKSDLDLLIGLEKKRIFIGRTLVTLLVQLLGKRRYGKKITNRICLNYFITTQSLEIETKDLFASSEYFFAMPLFGFRCFQKFREKNTWIRKYCRNYAIARIPNPKLLADNYFSKSIRTMGEKMFDFDFLEQALKKWQVRRIEADPRTKNLGSLIVANDEALVFLPEPHGPEVFEAFKSSMENLAKNRLT